MKPREHLIIPVQKRPSPRQIVLKLSKVNDKEFYRQPREREWWCNPLWVTEEPHQISQQKLYRLGVTFSKYWKVKIIPQECSLHFPGGLAGLGSSIVTAVAQLADVAQIRSLATELLYAANMPCTLPPHPPKKGRRRKNTLSSKVILQKWRQNKDSETKAESLPTLNLPYKKCWNELFPPETKWQKFTKHWVRW